MIYFGKGESIRGPDSEWEDELDELDDFGDDTDASLTDPDMAMSLSDADSDVEMRGGGKEYTTAEEAAALAYGDEEDYKMHPAILRANKQIYSEASSLLCTEGIIVLEAGDVFCLAKAPLDTFGASYHGAWRHNPLHGLGKEVNGVVTYGTAAMDGKMDPHVFARFQKVYFDANFNAEHTQHYQLWIDDDTHVVKREDAELFVDTLRRSTVMTDFVELISKSPCIMNLEVVLEVEMMVNSNLMMEEMSNDDDDDETEEKLDRLMDVADEKASELFLDSGICECLKQLSNVQTIHFKLGFEDRTDEDVYTPLPKHVAWIEELKRTVEGNFRASIV